MSPVFRVVEGVFFKKGDRTLVQESPAITEVDGAFESEIGSKVHVSIHHFPPAPPDLGAPGFGSCMWGGSCPVGHVEQPAWLFLDILEGGLLRTEEGIWQIGEKPLLLSNLVGHRGRLILFSGGETSSVKSENLEALLSETADFVSRLEGLKRDLAKIGRASCRE